MEKYVIGIFGDGVNEALKGVRAKQKWLQRKTDELAKRLADRGYEVANVILLDHVFDGKTLSSLKVEKKGDAQYVVSAESEAILFVEFGAGLIGYGHPEPGEYGPGTYPGKGHWDNPNGWWFETDDPRLIRRTSKKTGKSYGHSYGMKPAAPMYTAVKTLKEELPQIVKEVLESE